MEVIFEGIIMSNSIKYPVDEPHYDNYDEFIEASEKYNTGLTKVVYEYSLWKSETEGIILTAFAKVCEHDIQIPNILDKFLK